MAGTVEKTGSSFAGLRLLSLLAALTPSPAHAGAWIAPEGGQHIGNFVAGEREDIFYSESSLYIEEPLGDDVSVVAAPWFTQDQTAYAFEDWRWEVTLAGKLATHRGERWMTAVQAGAVWISDPREACGDAQAELRWLGGRSIGERSFANLEVAERAGEQGCGGERVDLTLGRNYGEHWLGMTQLFMDQPRQGERVVKAQLSLVRFGLHGFGVQLGLRARVDGEDAEPALILGLWGDPRR